MVALGGCVRSNWFAGIEESRRQSPLAAQKTWDNALREAGFSGIDTATPEERTFVVPFSVMCSMAVDKGMDFIRDPLAFAGQETLKANLLIIDGQTLPETLVEVDDETIAAQPTTISLTELDEPLFKPFTEEKFKAASAAARRAKCPTYVCNSSTSLAARGRPLTSWLTYSFSSESKKTGEPLFTIERELTIQNGILLIPRYLPVDATNTRLITHDVDQSSTVVELDASTSCSKLLERVQPSAGQESVKVTVGKSLLNAIRVGGAGCLHVVLGSIQTGRKVIALSESNQSIVSVPQSYFHEVEVIDGNEANLLLHVAAELSAASILTRTSAVSSSTSHLLHLQTASRASLQGWARTLLFLAALSDTVKADTIGSRFERLLPIDCETKKLSHLYSPKAFSTGTIDTNELKIAVGRAMLSFGRTAFFADPERMNEPTMGVLKETPLRLERRRAVSAAEVDAEIDGLLNYEFMLEQGETIRIKMLYDRQPLGPVSMQFGDFATRQRLQVTDGSLDKEFKFWKDMYSIKLPSGEIKANFLEPLPLFNLSQSLRKSLDKYECEESLLVLDGRTVRQIKAQYRRHKITTFHFFLGVLRTFLFRHLDVDDLVIGIADANRVDNALDSTMGFMRNLLPLRFKNENGDKNSPFKDIAMDAHNTAYNALAHTRLPFDALLEKLDIPHSTTHSLLFQVWMDYRPFKPDYMPTMFGAEASGAPTVSRTGYDLTLDVNEMNGSDIRVSFCTQKYLLVKAFAANFDLHVDSAPLWDHKDIEAAKPLGRKWPETISHRINEITTQNKDKEAVKDGSGKSYTYKKLQHRIQAISESLAKAGVKQGSRVVVFQQPSADWVCSLLAICHARRSLPRLATIAGAAKPTAVLCHAETQGDVPELKSTATIVNVSGLEDVVSITKTQAKANTPATILFTSGSTGTPKGVILRHSAFRNTIEGLTRHYNIGSEKIRARSDPADGLVERIGAALMESNASSDETSIDMSTVVSHISGGENAELPTLPVLQWIARAREAGLEWQIASMDHLPVRDELSTKGSRISESVNRNKIADLSPTGVMTAGAGLSVCRLHAQGVRPLSWCFRRFATAASPQIYDVAVIGGGPVGLSLLTALRTSPSTSNLKLALIESQDLEKTRHWQLPPDQYSNRASSLTPASRSFLERIGAWQNVDTARVQSYHHMRVWDGLSASGTISFNSFRSEGPIAYMTENQNLTRALLSRLDSLPPICLYNKTSVADIQLGSAPDPSPATLDLSSYPHVTLSSDNVIAARLLVGADGINSPVRSFAGTPTRGWDYDRHGVVATLRVAAGTARSCGATAYQRFLPTGPIALLALPGDSASLVWTTTPERADRLKSLSTEDFIAMVNAAFRLEVIDLDYMFTQPSGQVSELQWRSSVHPSTVAEDSGDIPGLVRAVQPGSIASFPLRLRQASSYTADRVALIGDAAHTIHPLAGQGLNMGLADSSALASAIQDAVEHGADIGNEMTCLDRYNSERWMNNNRMLGAVDKLHWLYSARSAPVVGLRAWGLGLVNQMSGLKGWFMRQAGAS
ncbi:MAG: hypothetical protein Q9217_001083 [Psora testacea]